MDDFKKFDDEDIMVFPDSIDDIEPTKTSYLFSTTKVILMFVGFLPVVILSILLLSEYGWVPALVFTLLYMVIYIYMVRLYVIEEPKQRQSLNNLEDNKYSDYSYFWDVTKIGTGEKDNGLLYLVQDGISLKRAYIVKYDSGSIVNVPDSFLDDYRRTLQEYLRGLGMSIKWYSIQKKPTLNESLKSQSKNLVNIQNDALNKLIKMQLNTYLRYSMDADQRYVNYFVVINNKFETLSSFRTNLEDILNRTLRTNSSFKNVEILDKQETDEFFATYYMQDLMDLTSIKRAGNTKPFSHYAKIVNVIDSNGQTLDMASLDYINEQTNNVNVGMTMDKIVENQTQQDINREKLRIRQKQNASDTLATRRRQNEITYEEYKEGMLKINNDYSQENFIPNRDDFERKQERDRKRVEKAENKEKARLEKIRLKEEANKPEPKWFEKEDYKDDVVEYSDKDKLNTEYTDVDVERILNDDLNTTESVENSEKTTEDTDSVDIYSLLEDNDED